MLARRHGPQEAFGVMEKMPQRRNYQCVTCFKNFSAPSKLQRHILSHTGQRPFGCHLCEKAFRQPAHLKFHLNTHLHPKYAEQKKANVKSTTDPSESGKDSPMKAIHLNACLQTGTLETVNAEEPLEVGVSPTACTSGVEEISCGCIAELNPPQSDVEPFEKQHTGEEPHRSHDDWSENEKPTLYKDGVTKVEMMDKHEKVENSNSHKCPECFKSFSAPSKLKRHCLIHTGQKPFQCYLCRRAFRQLAHLKVHYSIHSGAAKSKKPSLPRHSLLSLSQPQRAKTWPRNYPCFVCGRRFKQKRHLIVHQQTHVSEAAVYPGKLNRTTKAFPPDTDCSSQVDLQNSECSISYNTELNGKRQVNDGLQNLSEKLHNGAKCASQEPTELPFSNENRNKSFLSNGTSQTNRSKVRDNQCMICLKRFDYPSKLSRHLLVHMDIKPFGCPVCSKSFRQLCHLQTHMKAHYARNNNGGAKSVQNVPDQPGVIQFKEKLVSNVKTDQTEDLDNVSQPQEACADLNEGGYFQGPYVEPVRPTFSHSPDNYDAQQPAWNLSGKVPPGLDCDTVDRKTAAELLSLRPEHDPGGKGNAGPLDCTPVHQALKAIDTQKGPVSQKRPTILGSGRYCCPVCSKLFDAPSKLQRHSLIHTGLRSYECPVCPKTFRQKAHLKVHQSVHEQGREAKPSTTNEGRPAEPLSQLRRSLCSNGKGPSSGADLSAVPPTPSSCSPTNDADSQPPPSVAPRKSGGYQCMACLKKFDYPSKLSRHLLVHMGIKPFKCTICTRSFRQLCHLQSHMKLHSKTSQQGEEHPRNLHLTQPPPEDATVSAGHVFTAGLYQDEHNQSFENNDQNINYKQSAHCGESYTPFCSAESTDESTDVNGKHEPAPVVSEGIKSMKTEISCLVEQKCTPSPQLVKSDWNVTEEKHVEKFPSDEYYLQQNHPQLPNWLSPYPYNQETSKNKQAYAIPNPSFPYTEDSSDLVEKQEILSDVNQKLNQYSPPLSSPDAPSQYEAKEEAGLEVGLGSEFNVAYKSEPPNDLHVCTGCSQCFATERKLSQHRCSQRYAEKERPASSYQCAICFKSFEAPSKLKRHYVIHTGQRPFQCTLCGRAFTQAGHLKTHLQIHR
ncbi:zinc finger protein 770 [Esox lucius]|uniref:C2H2-type domain-containing protein n=1 Tax=Esox lucius TaxID=8010 RepID=A0AAY5L194_ESOLU|nr:zinc finger protein 770 [Esox lucius]XP_010880588.1 zinc finger protein 770 [Esox lucius]